MRAPGIYLPVVVMSEKYELEKKRILVVEDDFLQAREICEALQKHGATVLGPAPTVHYARLLVGKRGLDGAVLDLHLFGEDSYGLARDLMRQGVPIVLATGRQRSEIADDFRHIETLHKPIDFDRLVQKIAGLKKGKRLTRGIKFVASSSQAKPLDGLKGEGVADRWSRALARAMRDAR